MRKIFLIKKINGTKERKETTQTMPKPLEIYDFNTGASRPLFAVADKVIYRSTGAFCNEEITEVTNAYGVKFRARTRVGI